MAPNNEHHYDTHRYAGDQAADTRRVMNHMPDEDRSTTQQIQQSINASQSAELAPDVRMGDDRVISDTPRWESYDTELLYKFATDKNSPTTADDLGRAFNTGGNSLAEAANGLFEAVGKLDSAWTGVAADSAKSALQPLAKAAGLAGQTAQMMGVQMSQQSVAATEVRKLPPPKKFDQEQSLNSMVAGGPAAMQADMKAQKDAADAVKREQVSYLNTYTQSMAAVDAQTPSFIPPQERIGGGGGGSSSFTGGSVIIPDTGNALYNRGGTTTGAPVGKHTGIAGPGGSDGWTGQDGQTDQSGYTPLPTGGVGTGASGYTPPSTTTFGPGPGGGATPGGASVPGAGAGGFGGGFGSFGGGAGAAGGAAGAGSGNPGATGGGPKGMTPAGMAPGGGGRPGGAGGMGGAPRGKGDREEDQEHDRPSYLVEGDPESTFGNDALTAPPVIGGDD